MLICISAYKFIWASYELKTQICKSLKTVFQRRAPTGLLLKRSAATIRLQGRGALKTIGSDFNSDYLLTDWFNVTKVPRVLNHSGFYNSFKLLRVTNWDRGGAQQRTVLHRQLGCFWVGNKMYLKVHIKKTTLSQIDSHVLICWRRALLWHNKGNKYYFIKIIIIITKNGDPWSTTEY